MWAKIKGIEFEIKTREDLQLLLGNEDKDNGKLVEEPKQKRRRRRMHRAFKHWTIEEDAVVSAYPPAKAAKMLKRSIHAVYVRRTTLRNKKINVVDGGKKKRHKNRLSARDIRFVEENLGKMRIADIAEALGRTPSTIHSYLKRMRQE